MGKDGFDVFCWYGASATRPSRWARRSIPFALTCMVLVACLPSASNVSPLSERFAANTARIARIILVSTALSFLTFSAAVSWLA